MIDAATIRAWWSHRQGLDGSLLGKKPAEVLERSGWARSVGGVGPYMTLHARAGTSRTAADEAVARLEIHELPSARGCTYVVPAEDFALALKVGQDFAAAPMKVATKLGVTIKEIDKLCGAVLKALTDGPLDPEGIRERVGKAARSLGEEGKKKGVSTTLPLALGRLQAEGEIRRVPTSGRLDQQRYRYTLWRPNPLSGFNLSVDEAFSALASKFFRWIGPASLAEFQWFSGLGVKAAKIAIEPLQLVPLEEGGSLILFAADREELLAWKAPAKPSYVLVSSLDSISALRRDFQSLLEPADVKRASFAEMAKAPGAALMDLPNHAILDRGRLVGLWDFDAEANEIVWISFAGQAKALANAVKATGSYVRDQLGDARSFSLDSPQSRRPRLEALRRAKNR